MSGSVRNAPLQVADRHQRQVIGLRSSRDEGFDRGEDGGDDPGGFERRVLLEGLSKPAGREQLAGGICSFCNAVGIEVERVARREGVNLLDESEGSFRPV